MQSENLLRSECGGYDSDEGGGAGPLIRQGHHYTYNHHYNVTHYTQASITKYFTIQGQY